MTRSNYKFKQVVETLVTILLISLFGYTGFSKIASVDLFIVQLKQSPIIPAPLIPFMAYSIPALEIVVCFLMLLDGFKTLAFNISLHLLILFTSYLIVLVLFFDSSEIPCACGGVIGNISYLSHIFLNIFFILISTIGYSLSGSGSKK